MEIIASEGGKVWGGKKRRGGDISLVAALIHV